VGVWESNGPVAKAADVAVYKYAAATAVLGISTRQLSALILPIRASSLSGELLRRSHHRHG